MVAARSVRITAAAARAAGPYLGGGSQLFCRARVCRGRYAGLADEPRARAASASLCDRARRPARGPNRTALPPYLARICDEEAGGRRVATDLAARACVSQRRTQCDPPSRILDARMVSRRRLLPRSDGGMCGAGPRLPGGGRRGGTDLERAHLRCAARVAAGHGCAGVSP